MRREARRSGRGDEAVWLIDLDDTLHNASAWVFDQLHHAMNDYMASELDVSLDEAKALRERYWRRYGATLLGLVRHHDIRAPHFLQATHALPGLEQRLSKSARDVRHLKRLPGRRVVLTNAPLDYARRVLRGMGLHHAFDRVVSIESMRMFGHWRPKPDRRLFAHALSQLDATAHRTVLVDDSLVNLKSARSFGIKTAWARNHARPKSRKGAHGGSHAVMRHYVCARMTSIATLWRLQQAPVRDV